MGFFSRSSKKSSEDIASRVPIEGTGSFPVRAVGESHYQKNLSRICGGSTEDGVELITTATLIHDDENPYDNEAIRVEIDGMQVGHLSKSEARYYRRRMAADGHAGVTATCKARITGGWDRRRGDVGDFGVALDLPTAYVQPAIDEAASTNGTDKIMETNTFSFQVERPSAEELAECKAGDYVKLWTPRDNPGIVYIFRPATIGGQGKLGRIPNQFAKVVSEHLSGGWEYEARILSVNRSSCTMECNLVSKEETTARRAEASRKAGAALKKELLRKYAPGEPLTIIIQLSKTHSLAEGDELRLVNRGLDYYVEHATRLEIEFANQKNQIVAKASSPSGIIKTILRASFSQIPMTFALIDIQKPDKYTLPYLESIQAKIEVVFQ